MGGRTPPCDASPPESEIVSDTFAMSDDAIVIGAELARLDAEDPRAMFGSVAAMLAIDSRYVVADGINQELVVLDRKLTPAGTIGGRGEGPGEYQFPAVLAPSADLVAVLDRGLRRVYRLTPAGELRETVEITTHYAHHMAWHPDLGVLTTIMGIVPSPFPDRYLVVSRDDGPTPFGRIPEQFRKLEDGGYQSNHLVAVTPDNGVHVFDNEHLALVSYAADGNHTGTVFLPEEIRTAKLESRANNQAAFGAALIGGSSVTDLASLGDGRLFVRISHQTIAGLVVDPGTRQATPVIDRDAKSWRWVVSFTLNRVVINDTDLGNRLSLHRVRHER